MAVDQKRILRLLSAQKKAHSIAAAAAASAQIMKAEAEADELRLLHNASGANTALPSGVVHAVSNATRRSQRLAGLSAAVEQLVDAAGTERRLARQLERLVELQHVAERETKAARDLDEQLDAMNAQRMLSTAQVPPGTMVPPSISQRRGRNA